MKGKAQQTAFVVEGIQAGVRVAEHRERGQVGHLGRQIQEWRREHAVAAVDDQDLAGLLRDEDPAGAVPSVGQHGGGFRSLATTSNASGNPGSGGVQRPDPVEELRDWQALAGLAR